MSILCSVNWNIFWKKSEDSTKVTVCLMNREKNCWLDNSFCTVTFTSQPGPSVFVRYHLLVYDMTFTQHVSYVMMRWAHVACSSCPFDVFILSIPYSNAQQGVPLFAIRTICTLSVVRVVCFGPQTTEKQTDLPAHWQCFGYCCWWWRVHDAKKKREVPPFLHISTRKEL